MYIHPQEIQESKLKYMDGFTNASMKNCLGYSVCLVSSSFHDLTLTDVSSLVTSYLNATIFVHALANYQRKWLIWKQFLKQFRKHHNYF